MSAVAIRVEKLGKQYRIDGQPARYRTIRETLMQSLQASVHRAAGWGRSQNRPVSSPYELLWALREVSFEVQHGEAVGIIGANGAGKSTLLKLLSRITEPTEGSIDLYGYIGSLLEVGTGFHPELTGRENIYLNGAILGMSRASIRSKFDEIVSFAEVEKFIDTPVKHYSSGMYLRLAFAVAAHLEPDILLVDEVLAVGDAAFQQKCLHKMSDVTQEGRTVLFVSHNMGAISTLCRRAIWLHKGRLAQDGAAAPTVTAYLNAGSATSGRKVWAVDERPGNRSFTLTSVTLKNAAGEIVSEVYLSETITVEVEFEVTEPGTKVVLSLNLWDAHGSEVFSSLSNTADNPYHGRPLQPGRYCSQCVIYGNLLNEGRYYVTFIGVSGYWSDGFRTDYALAFDALEDGVLKRDYPGRYGGVLRPKLVWTITPR